MEGFPWDDIRKCQRRYQRMAKVPNVTLGLRSCNAPSHASNIGFSLRHFPAADAAVARH